MSNTHIVEKDDTLFRISALFYGDGNRYNEILQANPSITDPNNLLIGTTVVIPDLVDREEPLQEPETIDAKDKNEVAMVINGESFKFWTTIDITRSFDTLADTFSFTTPWNPNNPDGTPNIKNRSIFRPFNYIKCTIYVGGVKILTGLILILKTSTSANARVLSINGYSKPGIIADVPVSSSSWPISIDGLNLKQVAEKLTSPYAVNIIFEGDPGAAFSKQDKIQIEEDEKIGDFLIKLSKQRGFVIGSLPGGEMVFRKTTILPADFSIIEGEFPYISSDATFNGQNRFSTVTAIGTNTKKGAGQIATVDDPELKRNGINRPMIFKAQDTNAGGLQESATAKLGRIIADSAPVNINIIGWHKPLTENLITDNQKVVYQSDGDMIYEETEYLIRNVKYVKSPDALTASMGVVFPESYSGEIREFFPWDDPSLRVERVRESFDLTTLIEETPSV